jgi:hypothetical protein
MDGEALFGLEVSEILDVQTSLITALSQARRV